MWFHQSHLHWISPPLFSAPQPTAICFLAWPVPERDTAEMGREPSLAPRNTSQPCCVRSLNNRLSFLFPGPPDHLILYLAGIGCVLFSLSSPIRLLYLSHTNTEDSPWALHIPTVSWTSPDDFFSLFLDASKHPHSPPACMELGHQSLYLSTNDHFS